MRWILGVIACAVLGLAGCGGSALSGDIDAFTAGVLAFKSGDQAALDTALANLKADSSTAAPCSPEAFATARRSAFRQILEPLDRSSILSISEEARFVFLSGAIGRGVENAESPAEACKGQKDVGLLAVQDTVERVAAVKAVVETGKAWHEALVAKHGEQLAARLKAAARTLEANHVDMGFLRTTY